MDFTYHYSQAQEDFRREVSQWLDTVVPMLRGQGEPVPGSDQTPMTEPHPLLLDLRRRLGEKGWLAPNEPLRYGGMDACQDEDVVLAEELERRGLGWLQDRGAAALARALHKWANGSQAIDLIAGINKGLISVWHTCIAPEGPPIRHGHSPDSTGIIASEDGDDYLLNGTGWFAGADPKPDLLWTLAHLEVELPPSSGGDLTISLLVPAGSEGIAKRSSRSLVEAGPRQVEFVQVRVPRSCLFGPKGEGWPLMHAALIEEARPVTSPKLDAGVVRLQRYAEETKRGAAPLIQEPVVQQMVMDAYIDGRLARLFEMRDAWMKADGQKLTYQPAQTRMLQKRTASRYSQIVRQVVGVYALLDRNDPRAPSGGEFELQQRQSLGLIDPSGISGSDADIIARHLGLAAKDRTNAPTS